MVIEDIAFRAGDGTALSGWVAKPKSKRNLPIIVMTHGLSGLIDLGLLEYAKRFVKEGFACFAFDHRNWGRSGGWPRHESDPWQQVADMRDAITFAQSFAFVDKDRVGIWGTSYSGGHVLTVTALDRRVSCAVSQVPFTCGRRNFDLWVSEPNREAFMAALLQDRDGRAKGKLPIVQPVKTAGDQTDLWIQRVDHTKIYPNELTIRSLDLVRTYQPDSFIARVAPTPLMMIVATEDTMNPVEWQIEAFQKAGDPKELVRIQGGHYDLYTECISEASDAALRWYSEHL